MKEIDRKYNIILNEISRKSPYDFENIVDLDYKPDFLKDESKYKYTDKNQALNIELTEKATDKDKKDYIKYATESFGLSEEYFFPKDFDETDDGDFEIGE